MTSKRKCAPESAASISSKRRKGTQNQPATDNAVGKQLLPLYYEQVTTLRSFILARNPPKSARLQRRFGRHAAHSPLNDLLDRTLVGSRSTQFSRRPGIDGRERERSQRARDFVEFTQRLSGAAIRRTSHGTTIASTLGEQGVAMSELVDFAVWRLFYRTYRLIQRPPHVLCHGFQRLDAPNSTADERAAVGGIEGLATHFANSQVESLKGDAWCTLLRELGTDGDYVVLELLLDCGVFVPVEDGRPDFVSVNANYHQVSGVSLAELPLLQDSQKPGMLRSDSSTNNVTRQLAKPAIVERSPASISFVRSRMFYARATLNGKGRVHFGLRHIHVLNRYPNPADDGHVSHILKHVFPRQFGLHNVFTSLVDRRETAHAFKDYTLREHEIAAWARKQDPRKASQIPKRLRGECVALVRKLQRLHQKCSYKELLLHYCPIDELDDPGKITESAPKKKKKRLSDAIFVASTANAAQAKALLAPRDGAKGDRHLVELASPPSDVSAFVRSVVRNVLPQGFLGTGPGGAHNLKHLLSSIERFIISKRFENLTLEAVSQGLKLSCITWLRPVRIAEDAKMSKSDFKKRQELLHELLYYVFDSFIIPLIRFNFHVTESSEHKYRLFYFRHDVWRLITQPALSKIKLDMFQEIPTVKAEMLLSQRSLGFSQVRLLPKKATVRPITNLRRRAMIRRYGKIYLGSSINSTLKNVFSMLNYEKDHQSGLLQSSIFSANELYPRIKLFENRLREKCLTDRPLFFVKVDVQSCFDTIPQPAIVELIERICQGNEYTIKHHAEIKSAPSFARSSDTAAATLKPKRKFLAPAHASRSSQNATFAELLQTEYAPRKRDTVFVQGGTHTSIDTEDMLDLLEDHVRRNIVKIGKKYYRQTHGIPQGSVLSTLLCSFFYGDFERRRLGFLRQTNGGHHQGETMLVRLIDDFLLVTTDRGQAERFLQVMLEGDESYGISVKPEKTLTNFKPTASQVPARIMVNPLDGPFPWCNTLINTRSLAITRDRSKTMPYLCQLLPGGKSRPLRNLRSGAPDLADSTTLEAFKRAGAAFHRKTLAALRLNVRPMYTDMNLSKPACILRELMLAFLEVAERAGRYLVKFRYLSHGNSLRAKQIQRTIEDTASAASASLRKARRAAKGGHPVSAPEVLWMVHKAFHSVLMRQRSRHVDVVAWLEEKMRTIRLDHDVEARLMRSLPTRSGHT